MQYAKIKNGQILEFPYTWDSLQQDNPNSTYDDRFTIPEWFAQTEQAINDGVVVAEVTEGTQPSFTASTEKLSLQTTPVLENGKPVFSWTVIARTQEEMAYYNSVMEAGQNLST